MISLENYICSQARVVLNNNDLQPEDIQHWSMTPLKPREGEGEVVVVLADKAYVRVKKEFDKRSMWGDKLGT